MSFVFYFKPEYKAPFRSNDLKESCELAYNYFSTIVDYFIEQLPEHRLSLALDNEQPTLADKIHLIFPNGFGEYDVETNHNPFVWPAVIGLSDAVSDATTEAFAKELCDYFQESIDPDRECKAQMLMLQSIFDLMTAYLQLFVVMQDADSIDLDFKYPPEDKCGILIGSIFRKPEFRIDSIC